MISVEFFGVPRLRAGVGRLEVAATDVGEALDASCRACPRLAGLIVGEAVHPAYKLSVNGDRFVSDPRTPLAQGDTLLVLSADAGG